MGGQRRLLTTREVFMTPEHLESPPGRRLYPCTLEQRRERVSIGVCLWQPRSVLTSTKWGSELESGGAHRKVKQKTQNWLLPKNSDGVFSRLLLAHLYESNQVHSSLLWCHGALSTSLRGPIHFFILVNASSFCRPWWTRWTQDSRRIEQRQ